MNTPICDFVRRYADAEKLRLHMPGHKGVGPLGVEHLDITEIFGADSLYEAEGIIAKSEANASSLFGCPTFYSTEGSSQCIRAMIHLAALHARKAGKRPLIAAARNIHKTFLSAVGLLDVDVLWLDPAEDCSYLSCPVDSDALDSVLYNHPVTAVYVTSPDYLGNMADIVALSEVCHRHGCLLLVDNAHGAYLKFLEPSWHPMDLGADLCCDSAHKTLPVLTGGAYLHIADPALAKYGKNALALFGSTSPSYLILQSLDAANAYLADGYRERLGAFTAEVAALRHRLADHGFCLTGNESLKLTVAPKSWGYTGTVLAAILEQNGIVCEFADPDYLVLMLTPEIGADTLHHLEQSLLSIPRRSPVTTYPPVFRPCETVMTVRQALLSPGETVPVEQSIGRILSDASVGCPPAVPIVICGQRIDDNAVAAFRYYGINTCNVI